MFEPDNISSSQAVRQAQTMINLLNRADEKINVDGVMGPETRGAYKDLPGGSKSVVNNLLTSRNKSVIDLLNEASKPDEPEGRWFSKQALMPWIEEAAARYNVPESALVFFLEHEPSTRVRSGKREYDSKSRNGQYRGLMQMGEMAWQDAVQKDREIGGSTPLSGTSWSRDAYNPRRNILAAAAYAAKNEDYAWSKGRFRGPFTPEQYYAAHNQGWQFWAKAKEGARPPWYANQSKKAQHTIDRALAQLNA